MSKVALEKVSGPRPSVLNALLSLLNLACIVALGWLTLSMSLSGSDSTAAMRPRAILPCVMDQDGYLRGQLYGGLQSVLDWQGATMLCDGMPRPEGRGIRLVFSEHAASDQPGLRLVIGLAEAVLGEPTTELAANVTIIDSLNGRFFSTQTQPRCWARLDNQLRLRGTVNETWRVDGMLYCASALASLNDSSSVTLGDIAFSGVVRID